MTDALRSEAGPHLLITFAYCVGIVAGAVNLLLLGIIALHGSDGALPMFVGGNALALAMGVGIGVFVHGAECRTDALARVAIANGLRFAERPRRGPELDALIARTRLGTTGIPDACINVASGRINGHRVSVFDFGIQVGSEDRITRYTTVLLFRDRSMPRTATPRCAEVDGWTFEHVENFVVCYRLVRKIAPGELIATVQASLVRMEAFLRPA